MKIKRLTETAKLPTTKEGDIGYDLYANKITLFENKYVINTGIAVELPDNCWGLIADRSSMGLKGFKVHGGIIDNSYRGEIIVILYNHGEDIIRCGDKIAQLILMPVVKTPIIEVNKLSETERNNKGFGSTGE